MCLSGMGGQQADPALADFTPTPAEVPELVLRQRAVEWVTAHFNATGRPWAMSAPELYRQLKAAGFNFGLGLVKRVLRWLRESAGFTYEKIGQAYQVQPVSGQLPFVSHMSARPKQSVPELEPTRSRPDPDPLPVETQPEGVPTCPRHNAKLVPSTKKVGSFHCPARDPVQPRGWCTFVLTPIDAPAGVNPGTLTVDVNVDESPGDAGAGDGITPGGPLDSYRRRHGGRLPWETDPHVDSSFGGDPTTA